MFVKKKMELLAPAGTLEVFEAAVEAGADAVYIGAPHFNARELAHHFSMAEVAAMLDFARRRKVKLFLAMNSLVKEEEIPRAVETLSMLDELGPDGLIIQDLGLYSLLKKYFPKLRIHASTLMASHNVLSVKKLAALGFSRVVLPRELTIEEIRRIGLDTDVELEVFVHGAMCFSYSGMCMFSSFQGGKSGLRGRCVQPCRRRYTWQGKGKGHRSGYFFSMNDLEAIDMLADLQKAGVASLKIEGRMRNPAYVSNVVKAYRLALDSAGDSHALAKARQLLGKAMGRKTTRGYFPGSRPEDILTPQHSGNVGVFLGKIRSVRGKTAAVLLKSDVRAGDRLRLHQEQSGDRHAFSLKDIRLGRNRVDEARAGKTVSVALPVPARAGDSLYKVDIVDMRGRKTKRLNIGSGVRMLSNVNVEEKVRRINAQLEMGERQKSIRRKSAGVSPQGGKGLRLPLPIWIRSDDPFVLSARFPVMPEKVVVTLTPECLAKFARMKKNGPLFKRMVWALPAIIDGDNLDYYREAIDSLVRDGSRGWQVANPGQVTFFDNLGCDLYGDFSLNILNRQAALVYADLGLQSAQISMETDHDNLRKFCGGNEGLRTGMTIYGFPPLFTSRYTGQGLQYGRVFTSPRGESFVLRKSWGYTQALPLQPFSLLGDLKELAKCGLDYGVIDLSGRKTDRRALDEVFRPASGSSGRTKSFPFNYQHGLK